MLLHTSTDTYKKTCTYRRFYCTQCEEGLQQWQRQNAEIRTCI